jgi:hypothetical protein
MSRMISRSIFGSMDYDSNDENERWISETVTTSILNLGGETWVRLDHIVAVKPQGNDGAVVILRNGEKLSVPTAVKDIISLMEKALERNA